MSPDPIPTAPSRPIVILPWQPRWAEEYHHIATRLGAAAGDAALRIDHIGSTSVPGLGAKDVIDIQITVADLHDCTALIERLQSAGFTRGSTIETDAPPSASELDPQHIKRYMREPAGERRTHVHIRQQGFANQRMSLLFRDYLRATPSQRVNYETMKRRAAQLMPANIDGYMWLKDAPIRILLEAAELWATTTGWRDDVSRVMDGTHDR